jgi:hypothetical protein
VVKKNLLPTPRKTVSLLRIRGVPVRAVSSVQLCES